MLIKICPAVPEATATRNVMALLLELAAITVFDVQLIDDAPIAPVHAHPVPVGVAATVKPVGRLSVIVMVPDVATEPIFEGVRVKKPVVEPSPKLDGE